MKPVFVEQASRLLGGREVNVNPCVTRRNRRNGARDDKGWDPLGMTVRPASKGSPCHTEPAMDFNQQPPKTPGDDPFEQFRGTRQRQGLQIFGFPLRIDPFFFVTAWLIGGRQEPLWMLVWVVVVLTGVLAHELGHAFAGRRLGLEPWIRLMAFGGMTGWMRPRPLTPGQNILISAAGPAVGISIGGAVLVARFAGVFAGVSPGCPPGARLRALGQPGLGDPQPACRSCPSTAAISWPRWPGWWPVATAASPPESSRSSSRWSSVCGRSSPANGGSRSSASC